MERFNLQCMFMKNTIHPIWLPKYMIKQTKHHKKLFNHMWERRVTEKEYQNQTEHESQGLLSIYSAI